MPSIPEQPIHPSKDQVWWGRVFTSGDDGGNLTAIVLPGFSGDLPRTARALAMPDTGFVLARGDRSALLRTFSPVEELAQCLQTSLATPVALDAMDGERWQVRHPAGEPLTVRRDGNCCWVEAASVPPPTTEEVHLPSEVVEQLGVSPKAVVLRQARSRIHVFSSDAQGIEKAALSPETVRNLCESLGATTVTG